MYWITANQTYIIKLATRAFSCWDEIEIEGFGRFKGSSDFIELDSEGLLVKYYRGAQSSSSQEEFHISDIHFVFDNSLYCAHFVNVNAWSQSRHRVIAANLRGVDRSALPNKVELTVEMYRSNPTLCLK